MVCVGCGRVWACLARVGGGGDGDGDGEDAMNAHDIDPVMHCDSSSSRYQRVYRI